LSVKDVALKKGSYVDAVSMSDDEELY